MSLSTTLLIYSSVAFLLFWLLNNFRRHRLQHYASKLDGPPALPLIGSAFYFIGSGKVVVRNIIRLFTKYKSPWKIWLAGQLYVVLTEPEDIEIVLNEAPDKSDKYKFVQPVLKEGLFTGPVDKWKRHRKVILTTFKMPILNSYVEVFSKRSQTLVETLKSQVGENCFDIIPFLTQSALTMTCETAMGIESKQHSENLNYTQILSQAMNIIFLRYVKFWLHPHFIWRFTQHYRTLNRLSLELKAFAENIVAEKKRNHGTVDSGRKCFLDHLISLSEQEERWSNEELIEEAQTIIAAGSDSLGSTAAFTLIMLGMHPLVQDRVYDEIIGIFGNSQRSVTSEDLPKMIYLEQVIKETLRLYPVAATVGRRLVKDIQTDKYTLPRGCECVIALLYTHRNPKIWEEPLRFEPGRFTPEEVAKRHPYAYLPFSAGPRNCIGFKYALMAMKTTISMIVRRYKVGTDFKSVPDIEIMPGFLVKPKKGFRVKLEMRL